MKREFTRSTILLSAAFFMSVVGACSKKEGAIDGIGPWHLGKTKVEEGTICQPMEGGITWCSHNPEMTIAEHRTTVDLYFRGTTPDAPLVEILLAMSEPCDPEGIDKWLTSKLGTALESKGKAIIWRSDAAVIVATLPAANGECQVHFLDPKDKARLAAIAK